MTTMKNASAISSPFVTIKRSEVFKSQPHINDTIQLAEQKVDVLALFLTAMTYLPLGQSSRIYKPCRKESLPWPPHKSALQSDLCFPKGTNRISPNRTGKSSSVAG